MAAMSSGMPGGVEPSGVVSEMILASARITRAMSLRAAGKEVGDWPGAEGRFAAGGDGVAADEAAAAGFLRQPLAGGGSGSSGFRSPKMMQARNASTSSWE